MAKLQSKATTTQQPCFNNYKQPYNKQMVLRSDISLRMVQWAPKHVGDI
jgi:hypothetical protein